MFAGIVLLKTAAISALYSQIAHLSVHGGTDLKNIVARLMPQVMSHELSLQYTRTGAKGTKNLSALKNVYQLITGMYYFDIIYNHLILVRNICDMIS